MVSGVSSAFGQASALPSRVSPSIPILFFGDLHAYFSSRVRVLTVGLNPSLHEFPPPRTHGPDPSAENRSIFSWSVSGYNRDNRAASGLFPLFTLARCPTSAS